MKHNFGAGPCILPQEVFQEAAAAVLDFNGLSILEVSHRHKDFVAVMDEAIALVKKALHVPDGYSVAEHAASNQASRLYEHRYLG